MFHSKNPIVFLIAILWSLTASAIDLPGTLLDAVTKDPITGARVVATTTGIEIETVTDGSGVFALDLPDPPPQSMRLKITANGYQKLDLNLTDLAHTNLHSLQAHPVFSGEVEVTGLRPKVGETPVTVTNIDREEIDRRYWAQDVPIFLEQTPGFYAYSDSGNGVGYSYFFLRSFDMRRTAVNLNGVPLNDAHSHGVFFIDLADFLVEHRKEIVVRGRGRCRSGWAGSSAVAVRFSGCGVR